MKLARLLLGSVLTLFGAAGIAGAATTTIDFSNLTPGQSIGSAYAADGLTFSNATVGQCQGGCPAPNVVSGNFAYSSGGDTFTADFSTAQTDISFQAVSYSSTLAQAYNAHGVLVASVGDNEGYPISSQIDQLIGKDITSVVFTYDGGYNGPTITNLAFNTSGVPEPTVWLLMIAGIGGIGLMLRRSERVLGANIGDAASYKLGVSA